MKTENRIDLNQLDFEVVRAILDFLPLGVYVLDRKRKIRWINKRVMHRLEEEGFLQSEEKFCYKEIFKREKPCRDCPALKTLKSGLMEHREIRSEYKGEMRQYLVTTAPLMEGQNDKEPLIIETVQDITYQKKSEEELKRINDFNVAIIDNAPVAIFTIDKKGRFISVNPALAALSGLGSRAEDKLLGFNWIENPYTVQCGLADHIKRGLRGKPFELQDFPFTTYRGDGQHIYMHFRGVPLRDKSGRIEGLLCIIEDTTEKVKTRMQLVQNAKMSVIGRLMTGVAHELNNPLATIAFNSEFACELLQGIKAGVVQENEISELQEHLDAIQEQAFRCKGIINDMIDLTKKDGLEVHRIDLETCLNNLLKLINFKKFKIHVVKEFTPDLPPVKGDLNAVKQCFMNILQNAKDALEERDGRTIWIRAYVANNTIKVEIEDNGMGIHDSVADKIFDPFFSTKDTGKGVGLGLTLCYEFLNKMSGNIEVRSTLGKGSVFTVTLPSFAKREKNDSMVTK
jgi:PAS domain S-box-containing protein